MKKNKDLKAKKTKKANIVTPNISAKTSEEPKVQKMTEKIIEKPEEKRKMKKNKNSKAKKSKNITDNISNKTSEVPAVREMTEEEVEKPEPELV